MALKDVFEQTLIDTVRKLPPRRAAQVLDFARWLQTQPDEDDEWLNDSEEQMQAEDALWDSAYARHKDKFAALSEAARAEIAAGETQPMFDERREFLADEFSHHS